MMKMIDVTHSIFCNPSRRAGFLKKTITIFPYDVRLLQVIHQTRMHASIKNRCLSTPVVCIVRKKESCLTDN